MRDDHTLPRLLEPVVERALRSMRVVVVTGPRQSGKSTLVRGLGSEGKRTYVSLDDVDVEALAEREPDRLVRSADPLTIDEVQRVPNLLRAVKIVVDERRRPGRFLLTGSANLLLMRSVSESLAGRAAYLALWPLTRSERLGIPGAGLWPDLFATDPAGWRERALGRDVPPEDWRTAALLGGYPEPAHRFRRESDRAEWHRGYVRTYLERDLRDLSEVASLTDMRRLMRAACLRIGNLVNQTELGRDVGMLQQTVARHLGLLEVSYQLVRVPAYSVNRTKRLIKTPKLYWSDTALAMHLSGETEPRGAHLENIVLCDLLAWRGSLSDEPQVLYWRTSGGEEVDFVVEWKGRLLPIEVKATAKPRLADVKSLQTFRSEYGRRSLPGLLLHAGTETAWLADGVLATPWWRVV